MSEKCQEFNGITVKDGIEQVRKKEIQTTEKKVALKLTYHGSKIEPDISL
jgi:hypothetical protein